MTIITFKTYLSRIVSSSWISNKEDRRFDLSARIYTRSMEEQALSATLETLRKGKCIAILDLESKEAKINLFFPTSLSPFYLKTLRIEAGRELYIFVVHEVASTFSFFFIREVSITRPQFFFFKKILENSHHFHFSSFLHK